MPQKESIIPSELIASKIYVIRRLKVMLDRDLAKPYGVETKRLKRAVKRNLDRFPSDFMFELNVDEYGALRCQIGTLKEARTQNICPLPLLNRELPCSPAY